MSLVKFEVSFYYLYETALEHKADPLTHHVHDEEIRFATRFNCNIDEPFSVNSETHCSCSEEDFVIIMLTCPQAVIQS